MRVTAIAQRICDMKKSCVLSVLICCTREKNKSLRDQRVSCLVVSGVYFLDVWVVC